MALRVANGGSGGARAKLDYVIEKFYRRIHISAQPLPPQGTSVLKFAPMEMPPLVSPENRSIFSIGLVIPRFSSILGSMELMAVPKKKTSPHKKGIRNGPKALKPVPVIVRCKVCGRVKLPHFYCCGGIRPNPGS